MTVTAKLTDNSGTTLVDFTTGGLTIEKDAPVVGGAYPLTQSFTVYSTQSAADRIDAIEDLATALSDAERAISTRHAPDYVWLHFYESVGESPKRAVVYGGRIAFGGGLDGSPTVQGTDITIVTMTIVRGPWESTSIATTTASAVDARGGVFALPAGGNMPGRIESIEVGPVNSGALLVTYKKLYVGIRRPARGTSDFDPFIDISDTYSLASTSFSLAESFELDSKFSSVNYTHWQGRYRLLLFGSLSGSVTSAKLYCALSSNAVVTTNKVRTKTVVFSSGTFRLDLGEIDIPLAGFDTNLNAASIGNTTFEFWAAVQTGTTGTLNIDHAVLVPTDAFFYSDTANIQSDHDSDGEYSMQLIEVSPTGVISSYAYEAGADYVNNPSTFEAHNLVYPPEGGIMVVCLFTDNTHTVDVEINSRNRWVHYRNRVT